MAYGNRKSSARRGRRTVGGRKRGTASRARSSVRGASTARRRSARPRARSAPQTVRIVLETAGEAPVRAGQAVGIGSKVAPQPRVKPRF